jgi:plasmid stability protein
VANLTIVVDAEVLRRARIRALQDGTSVNAVLRERLEAYAADDQERRQRLAALQAVWAAADLVERPAVAARDWTRDSLHDR